MDAYGSGYETYYTQNRSRSKLILRISLYYTSCLNISTHRASCYYKCLPAKRSTITSPEQSSCAILIFSVMFP